MCKVLLPIKPVYAYQILNGKKKFEYRKRKFKRENVESIVIYATSPVKKIIGEVQLKQVMEDTPYHIWEATHEYGGIDKNDYDEYFKDKTIAVAYGLGTIHPYREEKELADINIDYYPQSYVYL